MIWRISIYLDTKLNVSFIFTHLLCFIFQIVSSKPSNENFTFSSTFEKQLKKLAKKEKQKRQKQNILFKQKEKKTSNIAKKVKETNTSKISQKKMKEKRDPMEIDNTDDECKFQKLETIQKDKFL